MRLSCKRVFFLVPLLTFSILTAAQPGNRHVVMSKPSPLPVVMSYVKDGWIYVTYSDGKAPDRWLSSKDISDLAISPDSNSLAFTFYLPKSDSKRLSSTRRIAVLDSKGAKPRVLESIPGENSYGPIWSPDSKQLMFNHLSEGRWKVAIISRDGSGFQILSTLTTADPVLHSAFWGNDGKSIYAYDSSHLYQIGLDGMELSRVSFSDWSISLTATGGKMALSPEGTRLLIETEVDTHKKNDPLSSSSIVYVCDLKTKRKLEITSHHGEISKPSWLLDENTIVFSSIARTHTNIYRRDLMRGIETLILSNASHPSLSSHVH
jgi:TolB protein